MIEFNKGRHSFVIDSELSDLNWTTDPSALIFDLKYLIKEYYLCTFSETGNSLELRFNNGQKFEISVRELQ